MRNLNYLDRLNQENKSTQKYDINQRKEGRM